MFLSWMLIFFSNTAFAQESTDGISALIAETVESGLPVDTLQSKAREGAAKGVPEARVLSVLKRMQGDLIEAQRLLDLSENTPDRDLLLNATAQALHAGIAPETLRALAAEPETVRGPAIQGLVDLSQIGFTEEQATALVTRALSTPAPQDALGSLTTASGALILQGTSHAEILARITTELDAGQSSLTALSQGSSNGSNPNANPNAADGAGNASDGAGNGNGNRNGS